jgi:hypothetical protein
MQDKEYACGRTVVRNWLLDPNAMHFIRFQKYSACCSRAITDLHCPPGIPNLVASDESIPWNEPLPYDSEHIPTQAICDSGNDNRRKWSFWSWLIDLFKSTIGWNHGKIDEILNLLTIFALLCCDELLHGTWIVSCRQAKEVELLNLSFRAQITSDEAPDFEEKSTHMLADFELVQTMGSVSRSHVSSIVSFADASMLTWASERFLISIPCHKADLKSVAERIAESLGWQL